MYGVQFIIFGVQLWGTDIEQKRIVMASVSFFLRGKSENKESSIYVKFKDKDIDIRIPIPNLKCSPKDWRDGKCRFPQKRMVGDTETINVRLSKLQAEILTKYTEDAPEVNHKDWLKNIVEPDSTKSEEGKSYSDKVVDFFDT